MATDEARGDAKDYLEALLQQVSVLSATNVQLAQQLATLTAQNARLAEQVSALTETIGYATERLDLAARSRAPMDPKAIAEAAVGMIKDRLAPPVRRNVFPAIQAPGYPGRVR